MITPSMSMENLKKASELAAKLKDVRFSISVYDPRDCTAQLHVFFRNGSGIKSRAYLTDTVLPVLRAYEDKYETALYKLGVKCGPSAENPWERRKEIHHRVSLEIQMHPEFKNYLEAIRTGEKEFTDEFEKKTAISAEDFLVFHDCVKNGR